MTEASDRATPQHVIDACEASLRDIAEGNLFDARDVLAESRRALAAYIHERDTESSTHRSRSVKPRRAA